MTRPIKPTWLLRQADELGGRVSLAGRPRNADLRRAVSAAYYALFHHIVLGVTSHLLPSGPQADRYALGRLVTHSSINQVCTWTQTPKQAPQLARPTFARLNQSPDMLDVAIAFPSLYLARHEADYDHTAPFTRPTTLAHIDQAKDAIRKLDNAKGTPELESFLAYIALRTAMR